MLENFLPHGDSLSLCECLSSKGALPLWSPARGVPPLTPPTLRFASLSCTALRGFGGFGDFGFRASSPKGRCPFAVRL